MDEPELIRHGTRGGFMTMKNRALKPDAGCREADNRYKRTRRARGRCEPGLGWPLLPTVRRLFQEDEPDDC